MKRHDTLYGLAGGLVTGAAGGFLGVGGGIVLVPILTGYFHLTQHQAHGTSLAVIGGTSLVSVFVYAFHGNVEWRTALIVAAASVLTARVGARLAQRTTPRNLTRAFAIFLVVVAARLLWKPPAVSVDPLHGVWSHVGFDIALGLAVGLLAGFMGVGGGIFIVPALTLILGWPQHLAQGTSLAVILAAAPAGAFEHARHGNVAGRLVPALAVGAIVASPAAAWLAQGMDRELLARVFALFLLANAASSWIRSGRKRAAPAILAAPSENAGTRPAER